MSPDALSLHVLVVEDESLIRWSITETLEAAGMHVFEAGDGAGALRQLSSGNPSIDVVLLDFRLPDSADLRLLTAIRSLAPESAVVLMSAFTTPEVVAAALSLGAVRVMSKPFEMHDLEDIVLEAKRTQIH